MVLLSIGVKPNTELADNAGIEPGFKGAIKVNENMETNIKDIYAVVDCVKNINLVTGKTAGSSLALPPTRWAGWQH
ncbi:hypothetical protein DXT63_15840 [Thermoanaerobacteraceae bacterium SP2]|jgi:pyruvate/2-oxoglutarate dehydrogenase complex dihydrolipoamide dehydrogenase (E3) component|nr:hypothetical protein DXT63_15840 [Thermoanaerobacteraceae bacterium SP2]